METRKQTHPAQRQLAALALGKLPTASRAALQQHVDTCPACAKFLTETARDRLVALARDATIAPSLADQSTPGVRDVTTFSGQAHGEERPAGSAPGPSGPLGEDVPEPLRAQSKYRVERLLGSGGMGSVYQAYHERMDRPVAIKIINAALVDHPQALERFDQEIKAAAKLDHPNVARAYDADEFGVLRVLVMEFVPGQSLDRFLEARGRLSVMEACRLVRQALVGLEHAHQRGMVHRDLKPQNLMLTPDGKVKILDFGLAKIASERKEGPGLTRDNQTMGTPHYLAPEQALDAAKADIRADIYSLGCTLYCLLSGGPPFDGQVAKVLVAHQNELPAPLMNLCPDVPLELSNLVDRMLAKNPADRPQTPREAAELLLPFAKGDFAVPAAPGDPLSFLRKRPAKGTMSGPVVVQRARITGGFGIWTGAAAVLAAFLFGAWALGVFTLRTPEGTIVVENVPGDADVMVDGQTVTLKRDRDVVTIEAVSKGKHTLKLTRDGRTIWTDDVTVEFGNQRLRVSLSPPAGQVRQTPNTKDRYPDAQIDSGEWMVDGQELAQSLIRDGEGRLVLGDPNWSRYNLTLQAAAIEGYPNFKITWHYRDRGTFRVAALEESINSLNTCFEWRWSEETTSKGIVKLNQWYNVRLEVRGADCKCLVDNQLVFEKRDERLISGRIAVGGGGAAVRFRNIVVTSEEGQTVLWKGNPKVPQIGEIPSLAKAPPGDKPLRVVDLMPLVDPQKDTVDGTWTKVGTRLQSDNSGAARLRIPYQPPEEYNFRMVFTRDWGRNDVSQVFSHAGRNGAFTLGLIENTLGGFAQIGGRWVEDNPTRIKANGFLRNGREYTSVVYVRRGFVAASIDGKLVREYKTNFSDISLPSEWSVGDDILGVFSVNSPTIVHALEIDEVTGRGQPVALAPTGDVPALNKPAPHDKPQRVVDLMPLIDASRDAVAGTWNKEGDALRSDTALGRIRIPYQPPQEYDLRVQFTRTGGRADVAQMLSHDGHTFYFTLGTNAGTCGGFGVINGKWAGDNATTIKTPGILRNGRKYEVVIHVRNGLVAASVDDKLVAEYRTDFSDLAILSEWAVGDGVLGVGSWESPTTFHSIRIAEITGEGRAAGLPSRVVAPFDAKQARAHQEASAKYLNVPVEQKNAIGMPLVLIPAGSFMMGSTDEQLEATRKILDESSNPDHVQWGNAQLHLEQPRHSVTLTKPCMLGATEVTIGQHRRFVEATRYVTEGERFGGGSSDSRKENDPDKKKRTWNAPDGRAADDNSPATQVTWADAVAMCNWLSEQDKLLPMYRLDARDGWVLLPGANGYRLPTEAEWEYACRAGTTTLYSFGDDAAQLADYAWYDKNGAYRAVGLKPANAFGLYDMHGNVFEWCQDRFADNYYSQSPAVDPPGPLSGDSRAQRGGSFDAMRSRSAFRGSLPPLFRAPYLGFRVLRVAMTVTPPIPPVRDAQTNAEAKPKVADFDGPGTWTIEGDQLVLSGKKVGRTLWVFGDPSWRRYNLSFETKTDGDLKICFDYRGEKALRMLGLEPSGKSFLRSSFSSGWGKAYTTTTTVDRQRWHAVRMEIRDGRCHSTLDGKPLFAGPDAGDHHLAGGRIAIGAANSTVSFRNIVVMAEDGKTVLWKGLPALPRAAVEKTNPKANGASASKDDQRRQWSSFIETRAVKTKNALIARFGGNEQSEATVDLALDWLSQQQADDGGWTFDGSAKEARIAATGLALLPFLGAGHSPKLGKYKGAVIDGVNYIVANMKRGRNGADMAEKAATMYGHAIATMALCEAYGLSRDAGLRDPVEQAVAFIVHAQDPVGGGWRYIPQEPGDLSVTGWQIMALKTAQATGILVPEASFLTVRRFLDSVQVDGGAAYGYMGPAKRPGTTAVGLLLRIYLGSVPNAQGLKNGLAELAAAGPQADDAYFNYYASQALYQAGGTLWDDWNSKMRDQLVESQALSGPEAGSWLREDRWGNCGGRMYCTALSALALEVYYRHPQLHSLEGLDLN